jgi:hypothetical protein
VQCALYSKPSGRILKLYSDVGKFLRDFFHGGFRNVDDYRAQVLVCFWLDLAKIWLKSRVESSDKLKNAFGWLMKPFIQKIALKSGGGHRRNQEKVSELPLFGKTYQQQQISNR